MTLVTQPAGMKHWDLVNRVLIGWDKGEMIKLLVDKMGMSQYFAWKILMSARFNVDMTVNTLQKLKIFKVSLCLIEFTTMFIIVFESIVDREASALLLLRCSIINIII
jgi:hypothetical protein